MPAERNILLRERLAALEHQQWARCLGHVLDNLTPENLARWRRQIATPYEDLTEREKDLDREWADRVLDILRSNETVPDGEQVI